jgi:hypothetical protein
LRSSQKAARQGSFAEGQIRRLTDWRGPSHSWPPVGFLATSDGLTVTCAFTRISDSKLSRSIVDLVEQIAAREAERG